jgi:hypothetical protein
MEAMPRKRSRVGDCAAAGRGRGDVLAVTVGMEEGQHR